MENKNKGLMVVIAILIVAVVGLLCYIGYDKIIAGNNNGQVINEKDVKELKKEDVKGLLARIDGMNSAICKDYPISDINSISTQNILSIGLGEIYGTYSISSDYIENHIKYILGDNIKIKHEDYLCKLDNIPFYKYENGYYSFNQEHPGHGAGGGYIVTTFFRDASIKGNVITINTNLLYEVASDTTGPTTSYFDGTKEDSKKVIDNIERDKVETEYEKIKDTLPVTSFRFERSEFGGYNLVSVLIK